VAQIENRPSYHGTGYLKKDKSGPRIYIGLSRPFKSGQKRCDLQRAEKQKTQMHNAGGVAQFFHEAPRCALWPVLVDVRFKKELRPPKVYFNHSFTKVSPSKMLEMKSEPIKLPAGETQLIQITDAALADTARRSGNWLVCKPGCTPCCIGVFAIDQLDAARLEHGLRELTISDPERAEAVMERARQSVKRLSEGFPGDSQTGLLDPAQEELFAGFANDEPCAALDPATGLCDLYQSRPMTCRVFGPPVRSEQGLGVCELCYHGATEEQIAACEMPVSPLAEQLLEEFEQSSGRHGRTLVAFALGS
jgi:Fe-S-cluster containining protein